VYTTSLLLLLLREDAWEEAEDAGEVLGADWLAEDAGALLAGLVEPPPQAVRPNTRTMVIKIAKILFMHMCISLSFPLCVVFSKWWLCWLQYRLYI